MDTSQSTQPSAGLVVTRPGEGEVASLATLPASGEVWLRNMSKETLGKLYHILFLDMKNNVRGTPVYPHAKDKYWSKNALGIYVAQCGSWRKPGEEFKVLLRDVEGNKINHLVPDLEKFF